MIYKLITKFYTKFSTYYENQRFFQIEKKNDKECNFSSEGFQILKKKNLIQNHKFFFNVKQSNSYMNKIIVPNKLIDELINTYFVKNLLFEDITKLTGFNYSIDFFTAYETIFIPKCYLNDKYQCYGCFCSPECSTSFLFNEQIDSSVKFERYALLNYLYCKIYNYEKNIKPAPNPYYTLSKYQGNLSINEYRSLFNTERFIIVVDKPLTRSLPELHEDNDDFIFNNNDNDNNNNMLFTNNNVLQQSKNEISLLLCIDIYSFVYNRPNLGYHILAKHTQANFRRRHSCQVLSQILS